MMGMAQELFSLMAVPSEISKREVREVVIGRRRFLYVDVQASDGSWTLLRIYVRAQASREIFRCDLPFGGLPSTKGPLKNCNENVNQGSRTSSPGLPKRARDRAVRRPVLIAPRASTSAGELIVKRGITFWRCFKVWKPRKRPQACLEGCEISLDWSEVLRDLAALVRWFFDVVAARVRREAWGPLGLGRSERTGPLLVEFLRPLPWPPPGPGPPSGVGLGLSRI